MSRQAESPADAPEVSVVVPAYNAAHVLEGCLESIFSSRGVPFEVIVVDDASTDDTGRIARSFPCRLIRVRTNIMAANCRNLGARHARGGILVFFDADERMAADTLARFAAALREHPEVAAVVGSLAAETPVPGFFSRFKNLQHHYTHQTARQEGATLDSGRMAIRRRVFEEMGGFERAFAGASIEDIALGYRMHRVGLRIRFEPMIQVLHLKRYTFLGLLRSDVLHRAIPWTGLMLRERVFRSDLNTSAGNVLGVAAAWVAFPALLLGPRAWPVAALALVAIWLLNRGLLGAAHRYLGRGFALRSAAFLPLMYLYQGVGLVAGVVAYAAGGSVARRRPSPEPDYEVLEPGDPSPGGAGGAAAPSRSMSQPPG